VTIVQFSSYPSKDGGKNKTVGQFEVVGKAWDTQTGGFNFDLRITEILADRFNANWHKKKSGVGKDIRDHVRPMTRLRVESAKIREVLSANNEYPYKVEQLHADVDLSTKVNRRRYSRMI
jgi:molecular chaperone DnaK (HSP70)